VAPTLVQPESLIPHQTRIRAAAATLILSWRDNPHLLYDVFLFGAPPVYCETTSTPGQNFARMMRAQSEAYIAKNPKDTPAINAGFTERDYEEIHEIIVIKVKEMAKVGRERGAYWRKRKDSRG
jgi:hypothetical protein